MHISDLEVIKPLTKNKNLGIKKCFKYNLILQTKIILIKKMTSHYNKY